MQGTEKATDSTPAQVYLVEPDAGTRTSMEAWLEAPDVCARAFGSGTEFLRSFRPRAHGVVVLDDGVLDSSGQALLEFIVASASLPVIVTSNRGDIPAAVRAIKAGAFDYLEKPLAAGELREKVRQALKLDARRHGARQRRIEARTRLARLTQREAEVVRLIVEGKANKEIARALAICAKTVEFHRARAMKKLGARHVSELVRTALAGGAHGSFAADPGKRAS